MLKQTYLLQGNSSLKDKILQKTKLHLSSAAFTDKMIDAIVSTEFVQKNPDYYIFYPYLFKDAFAVDDETLDLLSMAGFLYYRSTMPLMACSIIKIVTVLLINTSFQTSVKSRP